MRDDYDVFFDGLRRSQLLQRYASFTVPRISIGTARDFCDSADHIGPLISHQEDLKDLQRCWLLKAVLGTFKVGSHLVEIGAGESVVAGILSRFGYKITVVDPYDGCGNGPVSFDYFATNFPDIEFKREYLSADTDFEGRKFDGFYSISVMEHVAAPDALASLALGIKNHSHDHAIVLHAIDHVLRGVGMEYHLDMLHNVGATLGITAQDVDEVLSGAELDAETYFLSTEAHNRWRGQTPYDQFPMRRCISVHMSGKPA